MNRVNVYPLNVRSRLLLGCNSKFSFDTEITTPFTIDEVLYKFISEKITGAFDNNPLYLGEVSEFIFDYNFFTPEHFGILVVSLKNYPYNNEEVSSLILTFKVTFEYFVKE